MLVKLTLVGGGEVAVNSDRCIIASQTAPGECSLLVDGAHRVFQVAHSVKELHGKLGMNVESPTAKFRRSYIVSIDSTPGGIRYHLPMGNSADQSGATLDQAIQALSLADAQARAGKAPGSL